MNLPITERINELTDELDLVGPFEMLRIFRQSDAQIFHGWRHFPCLMDRAFCENLKALIQTIEIIFFSEKRAQKNSIIIISGAGTSGRLAFLCCRAFNIELERLGLEPIFHYLIAGGDKALLTAQELGEDNVIAAVEDLKSIECLHPSGNILYFGISCGFSAPYIASQLDYILNHPIKEQRLRYYAVLLGFNPVEFARSSPIENYEKKFLDVVNQLQKLCSEQHLQVQQQYAYKSIFRYFILNPIVGPETITGSTRMKGGTATKILLETVFFLAMRKVLGEGDEYLFSHDDSKVHTKDSVFQSPFPFTGDDNLLEGVFKMLSTYENTFHDVYLSMDDISPLLEICGLCLRNKGHIYYVSRHLSFGILGLIDSSECPPTFGASINDVRCFLLNGWKDLNNRDGDLSMAIFESRMNEKQVNNSCSPYRISFSDQCFHPEKNDIVIILNLEEECNVGLRSITNEFYSMLDKAKHLGSVLAMISIYNKRIERNTITGDCDLEWQRMTSLCDIRVSLPLRTLRFSTTPCFAELALKLVLNALSTGAHIFKGKVYKNRMVDVKVSNNKLYERAIRIIGEFSKVSNDVAKSFLLQSIYNMNQQQLEDTNIQKLPISSHIEMAFRREKVVPRALLLASGKFDLQLANEALERQPIVRKLLLELEDSKELLVFHAFNC